MESVKGSSNIAAMGHDGHHAYVRFHSGATWRYDNVHPQIYDEWKNQESRGGYFHKFIKPNHPGTKVEG